VGDGRSPAKVRPDGKSYDDEDRPKIRRVNMRIVSPSCQEWIDLHWRV